MEVPTRYRSLVVYRHLNYRWRLLGLEASEWLAVLAPAAVYLAATQLSQPWAGSVAWPAFAAVLALAAAAGLAWGSARTAPEQGVVVAVVVGLLGGGLLVRLAWDVNGLPLWPACSGAAALATYAVGHQFRRPPGALGRLVAGLWTPRRLLAGRARRGAGGPRVPPFAAGVTR